MDLTAKSSSFLTKTTTEQGSKSRPRSVQHDRVVTAVYSSSNREKNWDIGRLYSLSLINEADLALDLYSVAWFKVAASVTDSDGPESYRSRCIGRVSVDTQNKMSNIFKNY